MRLFHAFLGKKIPKETEMMLISSKPRKVLYGRRSSSSSSDEEGQENELPSKSKQTSFSKEERKQSQSSSTSNESPKPRPFQSTSSLFFNNPAEQQSTGSPDEKDALFRNVNSDTGSNSDAEMQENEINLTNDLATSVAYGDDEASSDEEEAELQPVLSGTRKKRTKGQVQAVPYSSEADEPSVEIITQTSRKPEKVQQVDIVEISSDEDLSSSVGKKNPLKKNIEPVNRAKVSPSRAGEEEELGDWNANDEERWLEYFKKGNSDGEFDVEKIIRWRYHPRKKYVQYRVKWKDFRDWSNTWEPGKHFASRICIDEFWRTVKKIYGTNRPMNTYKKDDERLPDSILELNSDDTDDEINASDTERQKAAYQRKVKDIRRDRFRMLEMKLYRQGKDINLAKSGKRKRDDLSEDESTVQESGIHVNNQQDDGNGHESEARSAISSEPFVMIDDRNDDYFDSVDSLEGDYVPLSRSSGLEREGSRSSENSDSSAGRASLQLVSASDPKSSTSQSQAPATLSSMSPSRSYGKENQHWKVNDRERSPQTADQKRAYAGCFLPSVLTPRWRKKKAKLNCSDTAVQQPPSPKVTETASSDRINSSVTQAESSESGMSHLSHPWKGAHHAPPKVKVMQHPNDPLNRQSGPSEEPRKRSFTSGRISGRSNTSRFTSANISVSKRQSGFQHAVLRSENDLNYTQNQINQKANNYFDSVVASDLNAEAGLQFDSIKTDVRDTSSGWDITDDHAANSNEITGKSHDVPNINSVDDDTVEAKRLDSKGFRRRPTVRFDDQSSALADREINTQQRDRSEIGVIDANSGSPLTIDAPWIQPKKTPQYINRDESAVDFVDELDDARVHGCDWTTISNSGCYTEMNRPADQSIHPDRRAELDSTNVTLNDDFQDIQIHSPTSPISLSSWRRNGPLPMQKKYMSESRKECCLPKSDSAIAGLNPSDKYEVLSVDTPSSYGVSETGGNEVRGIRRNSAGHRDSKLGKDRADRLMQIAHSWPWPMEIKQRINKCYHLVPEPKQRMNKQSDDIYHALIRYILTRGGGYKPNLTEKMKTKNCSCIFWIRDPCQPLGDEERECLSRSTFSFVSYDNSRDGNTPALKPIWENGKPQLVMYSLGALVCKLIEFCQARRIEDQDRRSKAVNVFETKKQIEQTTLCHPWQAPAITALLGSNRMGNFLEEVLGVHEDLSVEFEFMLRDEGIRLLDTLDNCATKWTNLAKSQPHEEPNGSEPLPDDLIAFTLSLDKEIHGTLMNMQSWCCDSFRSFDFAMAGCSMEASHIGTCYSRIDVPSSATHPDAD